MSQEDESDKPKPGLGSDKISEEQKFLIRRKGGMKGAGHKYKPEEASNASKKSWANLTDEEKSERARNAARAPRPGRRKKRDQQPPQ